MSEARLPDSPLPKGKHLVAEGNALGVGGKANVPCSRPEFTPRLRHLPVA